MRRRVSSYYRSGQFTEECESQWARCRCKDHCQVDSLLLVAGAAAEPVWRGAGQGAEAEAAWHVAGQGAVEPVWRVAEPVERQDAEPERR